MDLVLHVVNRQNRAFDREVPLALTATGITLGRTAGNDLALDDPERVISGQHARIDLRNGGLWLTDVSRNGTYLNGAADPVSSHEAVAVYDGDRLTIGSYEIQIRIQGVTNLADPAGLPGFESPEAATDILDLLGPTPGASRADPLQGGAAAKPSLTLRDEPFADALSLDDMLAGPAPAAAPREAALHHTPVEHVFYQPQQHQPIPEDYDLLSDAWLTPARHEPVQVKPGLSEPLAHAPAVEPEMSGDSSGAGDPYGAGDPFGSAALVDSAEPFGPGESLDLCKPSTPSPVEPFDTSPPAEVAPAPAPVPGPTRRPEPPRAVPTASTGRELDAFLEGLGVDRAGGVEDPEALLRQSGELLRALATGLARTLIGRAQFKSELRLGVTTIRAAQNNPFKFSVGTDDLLDRLLFRPNPGFMPGPAAAREAFDDIQAHEMAITAGLQAALRVLLARFDPAELERRLGASSGFDQLLKGRKARYWDLFTETYDQIAADASEDFMRLFGDAFASAYQDQIERLRVLRD